HGMGQHIWLLRRNHSSQYPLRNMYDGEFVNGLRHGFGSFRYANGALYEGYWKNNMKHGKGKFTFKNGRIYEGVFEKDHIVEYPDFNADGSTTPDISQIRTRTPLPSDNASVHSNESRNTIGPSFQLEIDELLNNEFGEGDREEEVTQHKPKEPALKMRQYLFMMKDLKLINNDLDPQAVIRVLSSDDPSVDDSEGCYNLELEMTFLEFFEALIGCAEIFVTEAVVKDPATPRPSTALTQDQSMYSIPVAPSRLTSH
ncbi:hypothetical protein LOTGIDRAFT_176258, partial [Lottia gigantea]